MNDFEGAREQLILALKLRPDHTLYLAWLGIINFYLGVQVGLKLSRYTNMQDPEYKSLSVSREKALSEAVKILNRKCILDNIFNRLPHAKRRGLVRELCTINALFLLQ
jgi:hypothetical protein